MRSTLGCLATVLAFVGLLASPCYGEEVKSVNDTALCDTYHNPCNTCHKHHNKCDKCHKSHDRCHCQKKCKKSCYPKLSTGACPRPNGHPCKPDTCNSCIDVHCGGNELVHVKMCAPEQATLGDEMVIDIQATAMGDISEVVITDTLAPGMTYVRSEPAAEVVGNKLVWKMARMEENECTHFKVFVKAAAEGCLDSCICVTACPCPDACVKTYVGRPVLACTKRAPSYALVGDILVYEMTVSNTGTLTAHDVVVTDTIPNGIDYRGQKNVIWELGDLCPGECRRFKLEARVCEPGNFCNTMEVTSCDAASTECEAYTKVPKCLITLAKNGPTEVMLCKTATYQVIATNTGEADLHGVQIRDMAPAGTRIVEAPGAEIYGNLAVWQMDCMKEGESKTFSLTLEACAPGCYTNHVTACTHEGPGCEAEATTCWKGMPGMHICVEDSKDPLCVGDTAWYHINVENQGLAADHNVGIVVTIPAQLSPVNASGPTNATVSGQTVTFAPIADFEAGEKVEYRIEVKAVQTGDGRMKTEMRSDMLKEPVRTEESTQVY